VDIVAPGDKLPFANNSLDYVLSSHVLEHFWDPIKTIKEWLRVVRPGKF
jgi:ubiquinone/menaquinone biosynthesis C-methylase UbiE